MIRDVFISYSKQDQLVMEELCGILTREGISYYCDNNDLEFGKDKEQGMLKNMRNARMTLMITSPESLMSVAVVGFEAGFRLMEEFTQAATKMICLITDSRVLSPEFPVQMQERFSEIKQQMEDFRQKMRSLGGHTEVYDVEIRRIDQVDVGKLMVKVRNHEPVMLDDPSKREGNLARLIEAIRKEKQDQENDALNYVNWDGLKQAIVDEQSILFIGPGLTVNFEREENQNDFFSRLAEMNKNESPNGMVAYHRRDGLLILREPDRKFPHRKKFEEIFNSRSASPIIALLAELPIKLVISTSPDLSFEEACSKKGFSYNKAYFMSGEQLPNPDLVSKDRPLVYHLLGCIENPDSLVVTHVDMFRLMEAVFKHDCLGDVVRGAFGVQKPTNLIFLGFDFDKWYFQLILHQFNIDMSKKQEGKNQKGKNASVAEPSGAKGNWEQYADGQSAIDGQDRVLFEKAFGINFVQANIEQFVKELHSKFLPEELRQPQR